VWPIVPEKKSKNFVLKIKLVARQGMIKIKMGMVENKHLIILK
jgi:hypothetical protein